MAPKKTILITGARGQLGQALLELQSHFSSWVFLATDRDELNLANPDAINRFFRENEPDYCINCAAYTAVDRAESERELAQMINAEGPRLLAAACRQHGARLLHLSSDYVYHNGLNRPLIETDPTQPKSVYAESKLSGEQLALKAHDHTIIVRTSWVYAHQGNNFLRTMLRLAAEREELRVVYDQIGTPTFAADLAGALLAIIQQIESTAEPVPGGIYNYSNEGVCSWYDFALAIFEAQGINCRVVPIETKDFPTPAVRPPFSVMNKAKIKSAFGLRIPHWRSSLLKCLSRLDNSPGL